MTRVFGVFMALILISPATTQAETADEVAVRTFVDGFFTRFSEMAAARAEGDGSVMPLTGYAVENFVKTSEADRRRGRIAPVDLVSKLFMHGPKSWQMEALRVAGDVARVDIQFVSDMTGQSEPIPMSFRLVREGDIWKFLRFEDLRKPPAAKPEEAEIDAVSPASSPTQTVKAYLDFMVETYRPANAANAASKLVQISKATEAAWVDARNARRASAQIQAQFSQLQPLDWTHVRATDVGTGTEVEVELTVGNKQLLSNAGMLRFWGGEKPRLIFDMEKTDDGWRISGFRRAPQAGAAN